MVEQSAIAVGNKGKSAFVMKVAADDGVQGALIKQVNRAHHHAEELIAFAEYRL